MFCMKVEKMEEMQDIKKTCQKIDCYEAKCGPKKSIVKWCLLPTVLGLVWIV